MKIGILQLSDFHIREGERFLNEKIEKCLKESHHGFLPSIFIISVLHLEFGLLFLGSHQIFL